MPTATRLQPEETAARRITCPVCRAQPGQACTYPAWTGRSGLEAHLERLTQATLTSPRCGITWPRPGFHRQHRDHQCEEHHVPDLWHRHRCRCGEWGPG